jgi:lysine-specific histone demethylase 1
MTSDGLPHQVALFFTEPFWGHESNFFGRVVANPKHRGRFFLFFNLHPASGAPVLLALASGPCLPQHASAHHGALASPQVLLALAAGAAAVELEESDDETITESALEALRSMFGSSVPPPTRTVVTRWGADKFARGSYSYVHVGASGQDYATLGEPVRASDCMLIASRISWASRGEPLIATGASERVY